MATQSIASKLAALKRQQAALEKKQKAIDGKQQAKAIARIKEIFKSTPELTIEQVTAALGGSSKSKKASAKKTAGTSKLAGKKVAPKYRNPANANETWTGRGKAPTWVAALKNAGTLDTALIK
jgi:DNA-binding protein H-NS